MLPGCQLISKRLNIRLAGPYRTGSCARDSLVLSMEASDGLWRLGILVENTKLENSFQDLRSNPMRLLAWFTPPPPDPASGGAALAMCKLSVFETFDNVHEYQAKKGVSLRAASVTQCRYPHVTLAAHYCMTSGRETVLMNLDLDSQSLEQNTGLSTPTTPSILVASQAFLDTHGYSHMEAVWVQLFSPLPLERVILSGRQRSEETIALTPSLAHQAMQYLAHLVERETVVFRQDTHFSLPGLFSVSGSEEKKHSTVDLSILECHPVLQGRVTKETEIVVVPQGEEEVFHQTTQSLTTPITSSSEFCQGSSVEESWETRSRSESALSNCSASDFRNEDELPSDPCLEVATCPGIKLHRHYVIVPETFAKEHDLYQYQTVLLVAERRGGVTAGLADVVLSTRSWRDGGAEGSHAAVMMWYDGQTELERYLPPPYPGYQYEQEALQCAYVHPHMLYSLFHETLSPTRRYYISIKNSKGGREGNVADFPKAEVVTLAPVGVAKPPSDLKTVHVQDSLKDYLQQRTHLVAEGDMISVDIEGAGDVVYRIMALQPQSSKKIDFSLREIIWQTRPVNYPLPCEPPPSPLLPSPPFFSCLLPPGLTESCLTLFSLLLPLLYSDPKTRPARTPAILVSGPEGVGKATVVRAVARRVRAHLLELNCYNYCSDSVAVAEKKFAVDASLAFQCAPCVVLLRNIHMIGRDGKREEPRLATAFQSYMFYVSGYNSRSTVDFPIVVVATSSKPNAITAQVAMEMLHVVKMDPPTEAERLSLLRSLGGDYLTAPDIHWPQVARHTAGFVLGDMVSLFSRAGHIATSSAIDHYKSHGFISNSLSVSGVPINQSHMQQALAALHTAHSHAIGAPKIPDVRWEDVGGLAEAKQEVLDAIQLPLMHPDLFQGGLRRSGVLLYGPPGTGKTLLAKAVATECGIHFLSVKGPELINMYVGQTEENVREIFSRARGAAPCIVFFDELDSIAPSRGKTGDASGVMDRVVSQLLAELDGLQKSSDIFVIGATNRPDLLDSALLRPGRFDRLVYLGISEDIQAKVKILAAITRKFTLAEDVDLSDIAAQCPPHLTGADLYALCSEALLVALRHTVQRLEVGKQGNMESETLVVTADDFRSALTRLTPSVSQTELERYQNIQRKTTENC